MSWLQLNVTVSNGSKTVTVHNGASTAKVRAGDALVMPGFSPVEIAGVFATTLQLANAWSSATQNTAACAIMPTFGDFDSAAATMRQFTQTAQGNFAAMEKWLTEQGQVEFKGFDNEVHQVRTAKQMDDDVKAIEQVAKDTITEVDTFGVVMTEAQAMAIREQNRRKFAASDFIYHGRHADSAANGYLPINEGLWSLTGIPNTLFMGRGASSQFYAGKSKTDVPVFNLDGITVPLVNHPTAPQFELLLPEAPNGTVTYDSATGVVTDFTTDVDPKYGDVAGTVNEAVSRAFEGEVPNGDFRTTSLTGWNIAGNRTGIHEIGVLTVGTTANSISYASPDIQFEAGVTYLLEFELLREVSGLTIRANLPDGTDVRGVGKYSLLITANGTNVLTFNFVGGSIPGTIEVRNVSVRKATNSVVIHRVDMTALEFYSELITDDEVFPFSIQNQSTTFGDTGIPTVVSDRPESYFQVFEGQTGIQKGRCVKWSTLTSAQKHAVASYLGEGFKKTADGLVQWRVRNRSFAGPGNGNWEFLTYDQQLGGTYAPGFEGNGRTRLVAQGSHNSIDEIFTASTTKGYGPYGSSAVNNTVRELSKAIDSSKGYKGECYIYVIATVPRWNQGAYHPSLNPLGARRWRIIGTSGNHYWYAYDHLALGATTAKAFHDPAGEAAGSLGYTVDSGYIGASNFSGRPVAAYYDAIYTSGLGGVVDHRLPYGAWGAPVQEAVSTYREAIKDGSFRGVERRWFTRVLPNRIYKAADGIYDPAQNGRIRIGTNATTEWIDGANDNEAGYATSADVVKTLLVGDNGSVYEIPTGRYGDIYSSTTYTYFGATELGNFNSLFPNGTWIYVVQTSYVPFGINFPQVSAEGTDTFMDVFAAPSVILAEPIFSNGWFGGYCGSPLPVGGVDMVFSRKVADGSTPIRTYLNTETNAWSSGAMPNYSQVQNGSTDGWSASYHLLYTFNYPIKNAMTVVGPHEPVHNRLAGIVPWVFYSNHYALTTGSFLAADTLQVITKNNAVVVRLGEASLNGFALDTNGTIKLVTGSTSLAGMQHTPIQLGVPSNDSKATKHLFHAIKENGRLNMSIFSNEIIYDAVSGEWGNDSVMYPGANAYLSDNHGAYYRATNHKLTKPLGWLNSEI